MAFLPTQRRIRARAGASCLILALLPSFVAAVEIYELPPAGEDLVGGLRAVQASKEDSLARIGRNYRTGYGAIRAANPTVDSWLPGEGEEITLPTWHILPPGPRQGIVINIAELRLYHYQTAPSSTPSVSIYAIGIGREGRETPTAQTKIIRKAKDPSWYPPESIRQERALRGETLPSRIPPGPNNPLGTRALYLDLPSYLIHGTNKPMGIGLDVSSGCIRMYPEDVEQLFEHVPLGTPVNIIHQAIKVGWSGGVLYMEAHNPLQNDDVNLTTQMRQLRDAVAEALHDRNGFNVSWQQAELALMESTGLPVAIGPAWLVELRDEEIDARREALQGPESAHENPTE